MNDVHGMGLGAGELRRPAAVLYHLVYLSTPLEKPKK